MQPTMVVAIHTRVGRMYSIPYNARPRVIMQKIETGAQRLITKVRHMLIMSLRFSRTSFRGFTLSPMRDMQIPRTMATKHTAKMELFEENADSRLLGTTSIIVESGL